MDLKQRLDKLKILFREFSEPKKMSFKKALAREGLIFVVLFGISYIVYLVIRFSAWLKRNRALKNKLPAT